MTDYVTVLRGDGQVVMPRAAMSLQEFCRVVAMVGVTLAYMDECGAPPWFDRRLREQVAAAGIAFEQCAGQRAIDAVIARALAGGGVA